MRSPYPPMEKKRSRERDEKTGGPSDLPPPPPRSYGGRPPLQHPPPSRVPPMPPRSRSEPVDREKTCPLLLRVFTKIGGLHDKEEFSVRGKEPKDEVQIYTWKDATLRELADLVKEVSPAARRRDAKLSFAFVYPDKNGRFVVREVGKTFSYGNGRRLDDNKALEDLGFQIGDYLDVADDHIFHCPERIGSKNTSMGRQNHVVQPEQLSGHVRLVLKNVKPDPMKLAFHHKPDHFHLVYDGPSPYIYDDALWPQR
ncbi:hypothetical protein V2J09_000828 [Rumex salicifolius]